MAVRRRRIIVIQINDKQLIQQYSLISKGQDIKLSTLVEDIRNLKLFFHMCFFCFVIKDDNHVSYRISSYALGIIDDKEWINSQSHRALFV